MQIDLKKLVVSICLVFCLNVNGQLPEVWVMDASRLVEVKNKYKQKDPAIITIIDSLIKRADEQMTLKPMSVMDKAFTPVSGDKHDYMSQAPYFWYDSSKPNGLPYIRKDGVRNPEIYKITDRTYLGRLETATRTLSLAWYLTGNEKYAEKSASLLRHWFLNAETKMNPHLEYGQAIPGVNTGRGIGIIETRTLIGIADAAGLLSGSKAWKEQDMKSLRKWYERYLNWLMTSRHGMDEHAAKNNHGTWFYAQVIDFALFIGDKKIARDLVEESKIRLDSQLTENGQQPLELARTNGLGYSTMNLHGWFTVARLAEKTGVDLWNHQTSKAASLKEALTWLIPFAMGKKNWPYQQISKYETAEIYPLLLQAASKFNPQSDEVSVKDIQRLDWLVELLYK